MQTNTRHFRANSGYKIGIGIFIILLSVFCFICDLGAFGKVGAAVSQVTIGFFGLADYGYCIVGVVLGFALIFNFRLRIRLSKLALFVSLFALALLALQIWTSNNYVIDKNYSQYLALCYQNTNTAGGMLYGVTAYPLMRALTNVWALAVVCVVFFIVAFMGFYPYIKKNVVYVVKERNVEDKEARKSKFRNLFSRKSKPQYESEPTGGVYIAEKDEDWVKDNNGFDPLYPNKSGAIEDEERFSTPDRFSSRGLARDILFGNGDSYGESLDRFNTIKNPESAFSRPGASYSASRRIEMRTRLGLDEPSQHQSYMVPREEAQPKVEEKPQDKLDINALREESKKEEGSVIGYTSFEALKQDQIRLFGERAKEEKEVTPQFNAVAYDRPQTSDPIKGEVEKLEVVRPTRIVGKPEIPKARQGDKASTMAGIQGDVVRAIAGESKPEEPKRTEEVESEAYEAQVLPAEFVAPAEAKLVYPAESAVDPAEEERSRKARQAFLDKQNREEAPAPAPTPQPQVVETKPIESKPVESKVIESPAVSAQPDWKRIFSEQSGRPIEKQPSTETSNQNVIGVSTADKSLDDEGTMYQTSFLAKQQQESIAKARKEAPQLSRAERAQIEIEKERERANRKITLPKEPSQKAMEKKVEKMEAIDTSKERVQQVTIDQSIYQATPRKPYVAPPMSLLKPPVEATEQEEDYEAKKEAIIEGLAFFGIGATVTNIEVGPTFSLYTLTVDMPKGRSVTTLTSYEDDLAMRMEEESVRILAPIPGKNAVGIEVPNKKKRMVRLSEVLNSPQFNNSDSPTTFALGVDLYNHVHVSDIKELPHMLVAGATGAGKSVCINTLLISLLYKAGPEDLRIILIDPKRVEMSIYAGLPHLMLDEIVCDVDKAIRALNWAIGEMNRRILFFEANRFRNIEDYNEDCKKSGNEKMPRILIVVDELADLMSLGKKAVEDAINRIARLARAVGIHLIVATQRPSVDVISGTIKNNLPTRTAFRVTAGPDSRTILDAGGAESLLGNGDMLFKTAKTPLPIRMQGSFVSTPEVESVVNFIKENNDSTYDPSVKDQIFKDPAEEQHREASNAKEGNQKKQKSLPPEFFDALEMGMHEGISISYLQRRLGLGFQKAARIKDMMDDMGVLVPDEKDPKKLRVNLSQEEYEELVRANTEGDEE